MADLQLQHSEEIVLDIKPGSWGMFALYFWTSGLNRLWRCDKHFAVTNQRVVKADLRHELSTASIVLG